jgi:hypothetical protein
MIIRVRLAYTAVRRPRFPNHLARDLHLRFISYYPVMLDRMTEKLARKLDVVNNAKGLRYSNLRATLQKLR